MEEKKINTELLAKVREKILETPKAYKQSVWGMPFDDAPCGTAACIAGWTAHLGGAVSLEELRLGDSVAYRAQTLLGLSYDEAQVLFYQYPSCAWPSPFSDRWTHARGDKAKAQVAADYLQHIIDTGKVTD